MLRDAELISDYFGSLVCAGCDDTIDLFCYMRTGFILMWVFYVVKWVLIPIIVCWILLLNLLSKAIFWVFQSLAQQYSSEFLQSELERTRINTACFAESIPLDSLPEPAKSAYSPFRNSMDSPSRNHRGTYNTGASSFSRHRHWWL